MKTGYVLDDTILTAFAQGNNDVANAIARLDAAAIRMAVPAVTLAVAESALAVEQCGLLNAVVQNLEHVLLDELSTLKQITELSRTLGWRTDPSPDTAAAHAATAGKRLGWWVLTLDPRRWDGIAAALPWTIELIELTEPPNA